MIIRNILNVGRIAVACHGVGGSFDPYPSSVEVYTIKGRK